MKATVRSITNLEEINQAKEMNLANIPEKEFDYFDFYFDLNTVAYMYRYPKDLIIVKIQGQDVTLVYDEKVYNILSEHLTRTH